MAKARLTATNVGTLPPIRGKRTDYADALLSGFVLRVSPSGARSYALAVWHRGRKLRVNLGRVGRVSLDKARDEARAMLRQLDRGEAPLRPPYLAGGHLSVADLVERSLADTPLRPASLTFWGQILRSQIAPTFGARHAEELGRAEVREWLRAVRRRSGYTANACWTLLRRAYTWGRREDVVQSNPCVDIPRPFAAPSVDRVLTTEELAALVRVLERAPRPKAGLALATRLCLLTGVRASAALGIQRGELEGLDGPDARWTVPAERSKNGRPHVVPLSRASVAIVQMRLDQVKDGRLFPRRFSDRWQAWLRRRVARTVRAHRRLRHQPAGDVAHWTIHGLRRTLATHLGEDLAVPPHVISLILSHTPPGPAVSRIYNRSELLADRRRALEAWADWLETICRPPAGPGRVLRFSR